MFTAFRDHDYLANANTLWASIFVHALSLSGIRDICISPGSRSAPISLACAAHTSLRTHLIIDERSAAFFAMGIAKSSHKPVAVLCTSGTAPANFLPAIVEAHNSCIPLIVISADRPPQLHHCGANQTTHQDGMFASYDHWHVNPGEPRMTASALLALFSLAPKLLKKALCIPQGPVHINFPFPKPLEPSTTAEKLPSSVIKIAAQLLQQDYSVPLQVSANPAIPKLSFKVFSSLAETISNIPRGIIVGGPHSPISTLDTTFPLKSFAQSITSLAYQLGWPIFAEPSSGIWQNGTHPNLIPHPSATLQTKAVQQAMPPQYILRFGAMPVDAELDSLLSQPDTPQTIIDPQGRWNDHHHHPHSQHLHAEPTLTIKQLLQSINSINKSHRDPQWLSIFSSAKQDIQQIINQNLQQNSYLPQPPQHSWFEGQLIIQLASLIPQHSLIFTASSLCLRYLSQYWPQNAPPITHLSNRGTNGIDGTISTALGAAKHNAKSSFLLIGDTALLHDSNVLCMNQQTKIPLKIILINNNGGGIFYTLPIKHHPQFKSLFLAPHHTQFQKLAQAHDIDYYQPTSLAELSRIIVETTRNKGIEMIEIKTDFQISHTRHQQLQKLCSKIT